jgi:hypothetical protein
VSTGKSPPTLFQLHNNTHTTLKIRLFQKLVAAKLIILSFLLAAPFLTSAEARDEIAVLPFPHHPVNKVLTSSHFHPPLSISRLLHLKLLVEVALL